MIITVKKSFKIKRFFDKEDIILPVGSKLQYVSCDHFYHAYYEVHTYKVKFLYKENDLCLSLKRIENTDFYRLESVSYTHGDNSKVFWKDVFEEKFPESVK